MSPYTTNVSKSVRKTERVAKLITMAEGSRRELVLSKSKFLSGLQCQKLLWHACHEEEKVYGPNDRTQGIFDQGLQVGKLARQLFPDGIEVAPGVMDRAQVAAETHRLLTLRRPLFEAGFRFKDCFVRVDILKPVGRTAWDMIEVKSTTSVKEIHLSDLAFQAYVGNRAGLNLRRCILVHINSGFVRRGAIDPKDFFVLKPVTRQVRLLGKALGRRLGKMLTTIRLENPPEIQIGPHCDSPYTCPLHDTCWAFLPERHVLTLYRGARKGFKLLADGIKDLQSIPEDFKLTHNQAIQRDAVVSGKPYVEKSALASFLREIKYPVSFLDFETFSTAIPLLEGVRPFQQVPFQFSLHVLRSKEAQPEHFSFLAHGRVDPRREFLDRLRAHLPQTGSVVVYNASFELTRLKECAGKFPKLKSWVGKIKKRTIDLLKPFRGFNYYHPAQSQSMSMKSVLPALTGKNYDHLEVQDGGTASSEFLRVTFGEVDAPERNRVRSALEEYCALDTLGMLWIFQDLKRLAS